MVGYGDVKKLFAACPSFIIIIIVQYSLYPVSFNSLWEVATTQFDLIQTFPDALEDGLKDKYASSTM